MNMHLLGVSILLVVSLSSCSTSPVEQDIEILTGQIQKIQIDCGGWGLQTDNELYELVKLPDEYKRNGLRVQMKVKTNQNLVSCTMVGPIVEVIDVEEIETL
jgi:hypothetical protein